MKLRPRKVAAVAVMPSPIWASLAWLAASYNVPFWILCAMVPMATLIAFAVVGAVILGFKLWDEDKG